jgi:hypothetical protein
MAFEFARILKPNFLCIDTHKHVSFADRYCSHVFRSVEQVASKNILSYRRRSTVISTGILL